MSTLVIPAATLLGDGLPDVCWLTGESARERIMVTFTSSRVPLPWLRPLVLLLGGVIAFMALAISATGTLAVSDEVLRQRSRARARSWGLAAAGLVLLVVGLVAAAVPVWILGLLLLAAAPLPARLMRRNWLPRATVYDDGSRRLVRLEGVHPAFVAAATGAPLPATAAGGSQ